MDLIKIGKYIAGKRKGLDMTQKQLAEKLGMSDKSVSKWERGICLPDVSIYSDLCSLLGISINEFLAGEDIDQGNLIQRSEETIIEVVTDHKQKQKGPQEDYLADARHHDTGNFDDWSCHLSSEETSE